MVVLVYMPTLVLMSLQPRRGACTTIAAAATAAAARLRRHRQAAER